MMSAVFFCLFFNCSIKEDRDGTKIRTIEIDQSKSIFVQNVNDRLNITDKIILPKGVANSIGGAINMLAYDEGVLYGGSTYDNIIFSVLKSGEINWMVKGGSSPINNFSNASLIKFNSTEKAIEVYDGAENMFYRYNLKGGFLGKESPGINFSDRTELKENVYVYDATLLANPHLEKDGNEYGFYLSNASSELKPLKRRKKLNGRLIPYSDNSNFLKVGGITYFKPNFGDTTFEVTTDNVIPVVKTDFSSNNNGQDLIDGVEEGSIARKFFREDLPFTGLVVPVKNHDYVVYYDKSQRRMVIGSKDGSEKLHSRFLAFDEEIVPTPYLYENGYFYSVVKMDESSILQQLFKDKNLNNGELDKKFEHLSEGVRDTEDVFIYILKPI